MKRVLGIDPGTYRGGYAVLCVDGPHAHWLAAGMCSFSPFALILLLAEWSPDLVVVERPKFGKAAASRELIDTGWNGGICLGIAAARGIATLGLCATQWRHALCARPTPTDKQVSHAVKLHVRSVPVRTNVHQRDAAGVALVGARLPSSASGAQAKTLWLRERAKQAKAEAKARLARAMARSETRPVE